VEFGAVRVGGTRVRRGLRTGGSAKRRRSRGALQQPLHPQPESHPAAPLLARPPALVGRGLTPIAASPRRPAPSFMPSATSAGTRPAATAASSTSAQRAGAWRQAAADSGRGARRGERGARGGDILDTHDPPPLPHCGAADSNPGKPPSNGSQSPVKPGQPRAARTAGLSSAVSPMLSATRVKPLASCEVETSALSDSLWLRVWGGGGEEGRGQTRGVEWC
jgi:hypothetical protein